MPIFEKLKKEELQERVKHLKKADRLSKYVSYLEKMAPEEAGRIVPEEGESHRAVRRRLSEAVRISGKSVEIVKVGTETYFWHKPRVGRPRKTPGKRDSA